MRDNPYAPPEAHLERPSQVPGLGTFEIARCLSEAWSATWANFPLWLGVGIVGTLAVVLATATFIGLFLIVPVLMWGGIYFGLRMYDGGAEFGDLFAGFSRYGSALVTIGVLFLLLLLVQLVSQSVQIVGDRSGNETVAFVGLLINLAFGLFVVPRLNFAYFVTVDTGASATEALSRAWTVTQRSVWKIAALVLLGILILMAGVLALGIGVVPATVIVYLMWVSAYRQMVGMPAAPSRA